MSPIFITGATGLVGRAVTDELARRAQTAIALVRQPPPERAPHLRYVNGDLTDPSGLDAGLEGVETVVHLAALTGAATARDFARVNVEGSRGLLDAAVAAGVKRFVFVSSIAAGFDDLDDYPYGASKRDAEALVRDSRLEHTIVRPAVVIGPRSPILDRFHQLARLPISLLPLSGMPRVQPIWAGDLARVLLDLASIVPPVQETIEVGGPEVVTLLELLTRVRVACSKKAGPIVRVPLGPIRLGLQAAAALTRGRFPVSPAQLAMFEQDGVARPHSFVDERRSAFMGLDSMLRKSLHS